VPETDAIEVALERGPLQRLGHAIGNDEARVAGIQVHRVALEGRVAEEPGWRATPAQEMRTRLALSQSLVDGRRW
jgi:hypothetical protein